MHSSTLSRFSSDTLVTVFDSRLVAMSSNGKICLVVFIVSDLGLFLCLGLGLVA